MKDCSARPYEKLPSWTDVVVYAVDVAVFDDDDVVMERLACLDDFMGGLGGLSEGVDVLHFFDTRHGESVNRSSLGLGVAISPNMQFVVVVVVVPQLVIICVYRSAHVVRVGLLFMVF